MFGKRLKDGNRRVAPRKRAPLDALIMYGTGQRVKCSVVDMSGSGALLRVSSILGLPNRFKLQEGRGAAHSVEVVRREASRLAVRFV